MLRLTIFGRFRADDDLGNEVPIKSKKARALLAYLALPPGKPRSREELMALLWSDRGDDQARGSLRQALSGLRRDLGNDLAASLCVADDAISLDAERVAVKGASPGDELLEGLHINDPAFDEWLRDERLQLDDKTVADNLQSEPLATTDRLSVAVLPFVNMSSDPEQEYFSDGITEDILIGLSRFRELFIIARNSSFTYKGRTVRVQEIGEELGVRYVVEGSVRKLGDRLRVTVQLIDVVNGNHLWTQRYDRKVEDILAIQDEITETIVATLAGRLGELGVDYAKRKPTHSMTAFDYVLRARQLIYRYKRETILEAQELLEKAIVLDPEYAIAHAWLSEACWDEWKGGWTKNADASFERSVQAAAQAVLLDDTDPQVCIHMGLICLSRRQYDEARFHLDRALSLNPNEPNAWMEKSRYSTSVGDYENAIAQIGEAVRMDPLGHYGYMAGMAHYTARNYDEAITSFEIVRGDIQHVKAWLAACHAQRGDSKRAQTFVTELVDGLTKAMGDAGAQPPASWLKFMEARQPYKHQEDMDHLLDGLRKAGLE